MADNYPISDGDYIVFTAQSGTSVKIYKDGPSFKLLKTNYPPVSGIISLTAKPYPPLYYLVNQTEDSDPDRAGQLFPTTNPTITIYDTDILKISVLLSDASQSYPIVITTNTNLPLNPVRVGTILNNNTGSGIIRWYPGVGNTGVFHYLYANSVTTPFGGTINVISSS